MTAVSRPSRLNMDYPALVCLCVHFMLMSDTRRRNDRDGVQPAAPRGHFRRRIIRAERGRGSQDGGGRRTREDRRNRAMRWSGSLPEPPVQQGVANGEKSFGQDSAGVPVSGHSGLGGAYKVKYGLLTPEWHCTVRVGGGASHGRRRVDSHATTSIRMLFYFFSGSFRWTFYPRKNVPHVVC